MTTAYIGLGSNEGDRMTNLARAVDAIAEIPDTRVEAVSPAYESEPAYMTDQPKFANAVVEAHTELEADQLLGYLQQIEDSLGRARDVEKGPRTIDLDILLFGEEEITSPELTIPHTGLLERDFVVTPLLDIAPRLHMPDGTLITREGATEGAVVGELGEIPDLGAMHNEPVLAEDWVAVAQSDTEQDVVAGWDAALMFKREALEQAGIPHAWDPYEPDATIDPFGMSVTFKLMVPAEYEEEVRALFEDIDSAKIVYPAGEGDVPAL